jgi:hypothetical protein
MSTTVTVTNNTTRLLSIWLPPRKDGLRNYRIKLMPGDNDVPVEDWAAAGENKTAQKWVRLGSLQDRTGNIIPDRAMISVPAAA